jgi:hypothetical protein
MTDKELIPCKSCGNLVDPDEMIDGQCLECAISCQAEELPKSNNDWWPSYHIE